MLLRAQDETRWSQTLLTGEADMVDSKIRNVIITISHDQFGSSSSQKWLVSREMKLSYQH